MSFSTIAHLLFFQDNGQCLTALQRQSVSRVQQFCDPRTGATDQPIGSPSLRTTPNHPGFHPSRNMSPIISGEHLLEAMKVGDLRLQRCAPGNLNPSFPCFKRHVPETSRGKSLVSGKAGRALPGFKEANPLQKFLQYTGPEPSSPWSTYPGWWEIVGNHKANRHLQGKIQDFLKGSVRPATHTLGLPAPSAPPTPVQADFKSMKQMTIPLLLR